MPLSSFSFPSLRACVAALCVVVIAPLHAAIVHGTVTDPLGAAVFHANVALVQNGKVVANVATGADGSYEVHTNGSGRFYVLVSAGSFRQLTSESFYAGRLDSHEANVVLEPAHVNQEIVVTATGTPTPEAQVSASISVVREPEFRNQVDLVDSLRIAPGTTVVRTGQYGGITSLFIRGGSSDANKVSLDGVSIEDIGGRFDVANLATTGIGQFELYRGPNTVLYGADAAAGALQLSTPRGSTPFPSIFYEGDAGNLGTFRNQVQLGGTHNHFDYFGGFSAFQSANAIKMDQYHDNTGAVNLGWSPTASTQVRVKARESTSAVGLPGAYDFYAMPNDGKQSDQDIYGGAAIENQTTESWHNLVRYGLARKREEAAQWYPAGIPITTTQFGFTSTNYYGGLVTIRGASGTAVSGQALLNYAGIYPNTSELVSNRDQLYFQSDYRFTPHMVGLIGFRYEDERGAVKYPAFGLAQTLERANYDYTAMFQGDFKNRLFYSLGGGVEKNQLYGTVGAPRLGVAYYPVRPGQGVLHGTKVKFNFAKGYKEPTLSDQFGSLYAFLAGEPGGTAAIQQLRVRPIGAAQSRTYEGGVEQSLFSERGVLRATYFHNEFGNQVESVPPSAVPALLPQLTPAEQQTLEDFLANSFGIDLNSQAFRAQGVETELEFGLLRNLFVRGGYTYLDSVVQRSFSSDALNPSFNTGLPGQAPPAFANVPIGAFSPLRGARPFLRPPHTGFLAVTYSGARWAGSLTGSFVSRSDDSTFLAGSDVAGGNSLLLPNRNLDPGYPKLDLGGSYQLRQWLGVYAQLTNLTNNQHMGPIGYPSLPFTFRSGLRFAWGHERK